MMTCLPREAKRRPVRPLLQLSWTWTSFPCKIGAQMPLWSGLWAQDPLNLWNIMGLSIFEFSFIIRRLAPKLKEEDIDGPSILLMSKNPDMLSVLNVKAGLKLKFLDKIRALTGTPSSNSLWTQVANKRQLILNFFFEGNMWFLFI